MRGFVVVAGMVLVSLLIGGCPGSAALAPDAKSGADQSWDTPTELVLDMDGDEGEAEASDSVTYPGGDRVDWRYVDVPEQGTLTVTLMVQPARPGLGLAMHVLDEDYRIQGKRLVSGTLSGKIKLSDVEPGRYFIQVYAPRVRDAAVYDLSLSFRKAPPDKDDLIVATNNPVLFDKDLLPDPETLPGVPLPPVTMAPDAGVGVPPQKIDAAVAQPPVADAGVAKTIDAGIAPMTLQIQDVSAGPGNTTLITVIGGANRGVGKSWKGTILVKNTKKPLAGGQVKVVRVMPVGTLLETRVSLDVAQQHDFVLLGP